MALSPHIRATKTFSTPHPPPTLLLSNSPQRGLPHHLPAHRPPNLTHPNPPSPSLCAGRSINFLTSIPHNQGRYLHNGEKAAMVDVLFGSDNLLPELWEVSGRWGAGWLG